MYSFEKMEDRLLLHGAPNSHATIEDSVLVGSETLGGPVLVGSDAHGDNLHVNKTGAVNAVGGYGDDKVKGDKGDNVLVDGPGSDKVMGMQGNDVVMAVSDGWEPKIAQEVNADNDPDGEVGPGNTINPNQPLPASQTTDTLIGNSGADQFVVRGYINGKREILERNAGADGDIDWTGNGVAGENDEVHDHWVDTTGLTIVEDFTPAEGDTLLLEGHTFAVASIEHIDGDTLIQIVSDQGAGGGAHDGDDLGQVLVLDNLLADGDFEVNANVFYGIIDNISQIEEAIDPTYVPRLAEIAAAAHADDEGPGRGKGRKK